MSTADGFAATTHRHDGSPDTTERDPVCGMTVKPTANSFPDWEPGMPGFAALALTARLLKPVSNSWRAGIWFLIS
jgi:hypothetical protein